MRLIVERGVHLEGGHLVAVRKMPLVEEKGHEWVAKTDRNLVVVREVDLEAGNLVAG
jgi:hypothetical protein